MVALAEKHGVVLVMELLNSKIDHKDYQCDRVEWGAELCKRLGSENFKLLFDIYHMQIDEGDVIRNIRAYHQYITHYHTGGVPGRNEIDDTQELYYPAIMKAIVETGTRALWRRNSFLNTKTSWHRLKQPYTFATFKPLGAAQVLALLINYIHDNQTEFFGPGGHGFGSIDAGAAITIGKRQKRRRPAII
jgi:hypothetical protein